MSNSAAYLMGQVTALYKLGMDEEMPPMDPAMLPPEEEMPPMDEPGLTSDAFVNFAESDDTSEIADPTQDELPEAAGDEKKPHWGGNASLDAGDAGTRGMEMGLPVPGAA